MKKHLSAFLIVLLLISPGPLGVRPAHAAIPLAAVAVGALITSGLVAGAGIYKPVSTPSPGFSVDPVFATMHLPVIAAVALGASKYGKSFTLDMDFGKWTDYAKAHPTELPTLSPAVIQAWRDYNSPAPLVGTVYAKTDLSRWKVLTLGTPTLQLIGTFDSSVSQDQVWKNYWGTAPVDQIGGYRALYGGQIYYGLYSTVAADGRLVWWFYHCPYTVAATTDPVNPPVTGYTDPKAVAAAVPLTAPAQDDAGKIVAGNPGVVTPATVPAPFTPAQIAAAQAAATAAQAATAAAQAQTAAAQDTTNTALQVAADQAAIAAEAAAAQAQVEEDVKTDDPPQTDIPPPPGPALDQDLQIDFSPFLGLKDKAMSKFPFSAVYSLGSIFSGLTADPVTPSMDMPMPWGLPSAKISLSKWDDFAAKWRFLIAMMFHASCIYAIVRRYA